MRMEKTREIKLVLLYVLINKKDCFSPLVRGYRNDNNIIPPGKGVRGM
jgi:hypothetical protein